MNQNDFHPEILKLVPGTVGSIIALRWISGPPLQRIMALIGGVGGSYYGAPWVADFIGSDLGLAGFMVGLFGMAAASKVFEALAVITPASLLERILKRLGL